MSVNGSTDRDPGRDDDDVVVRKGENGWVVGGENVSDLTSAMVLADLFAADQSTGGAAGPESAEGQHGTSSPEPAAASPAPGPAAAGRAAGGRGQAGPSVPDDRTEAVEADRLAVTVAQLEHALASRVRVEQAIGVLAERHRMRPRDAFDLLRRAARSRGRRVTEIAQDVVASAANPLLRLPEELSRKLPEQRPRGRSMRRGGRHAQRA